MLPENHRTTLNHTLLCEALSVKPISHLTFEPPLKCGLAAHLTRRITGSTYIVAQMTPFAPINFASVCGIVGRYFSVVSWEDRQSVSWYLWKIQGRGIAGRSWYRFQDQHQIFRIRVAGCTCNLLAYLPKYHHNYPNYPLT